MRLHFMPLIFKVRSLQTKLTDAQRNVTEHKQLLESQTVTLAEKARMIQERDEKCEKLKKELLDLKKEIQVREYFRSIYYMVSTMYIK